KGKHPLQLVLAERSNEWNMAQLERRLAIRAQFELRPPSKREAERLIAVLERVGCLGSLENLSSDDRVRAITKPGGLAGDLLVAIYQTTHGRSLQDIICDEYEHITPEKAQDIYLTICALNRMNVLVRAGSISRIHRVTFNEFQEKFLQPLDKVVFAIEEPSKDIWYKTRHPV